MVYSRDMRFNEEQTGVEKGVSSAELDIERCVQLELTSDDFPKVVDVEDSLEIGNSEPVRRPTREQRRPDYLAESVFFASTEEPGTYRETVSSPRWKQAMADEMKSFRKNEVWELVEPPLGRKVIGSKCVYKIKRDGNVRIERYKARLVTQGYTQTKGADYDEPFSPVVRMESLRMIVGLAAKHTLKLHQLDVTTAFLNGKLQEEVYMEQPDGFIAEGQEKLVCKQRRRIYGLKQSPRCWNTTLDA